MARIFTALMLTVFVTSAFSRYQYYTTEQKGVKSLGPNVRRLYHVPSGQCSGLLNNKDLRCKNGKWPSSIRVDMADAVPYATVNISNKLDSVSILRERDDSGQCPTRAHVNVSVFCSYLTQMSERRGGRGDFTVRSRLPMNYQD